MMLSCHKVDYGHRWQMMTAVIMKIFAISMESFDTESQYIEGCHPATCIHGLFG